MIKLSVWIHVLCAVVLLSLPKVSFAHHHITHCVDVVITSDSSGGKWDYRAKCVNSEGGLVHRQAIRDFMDPTRADEFHELFSICSSLSDTVCNQPRPTAISLSPEQFIFRARDNPSANVGYVYWGATLEGGGVGWTNGAVLKESGPPTAPTVPTSVMASDGAPGPVISVNWSESSAADLYKVERAEGATGPFIWHSVGQRNNNGFFDLATVPGVAYQYRVQACNDSEECSVFSDHDQGFRALGKPELLSDTLSSEFHFYTLLCSSVSGAIYYEGYETIETKFRSVFEGFEGEYKLISSGPTCGTIVDGRGADKSTFPTVAIRACTPFICGPAVIWNDERLPSISAILNLILSFAD